jgi:hypothetical protein
MSTSEKNPAAALGSLADHAFTPPKASPKRLIAQKNSGGLSVYSRLFRESTV